MSAFSPEWLALREPADHRARSRRVAAELERWRRGRGPLRVLDLGSGTGANLRWTAPRLGGTQAWHLVDRDPRLLVAAIEATLRWTDRIGARATTGAAALRLHARGWRCTVTLEELDLASGLGRLALDRYDLVTASALLDLTSAGWLAHLAGRCRRAGAAVLFTLSFDGRAAWQPADPWDAFARDLLSRHQRTDKGFGPALGPTAARRAARLLSSLGARVTTGRSDWRLGPHAGPLQERLLEGWVGAALELEPRARPVIEAWAARRRTLIGGGHSRLVVGHLDLFATPGVRP